MSDYKNSVLVVGFNTRPLATSLNLAGYKVYAVDFFGDVDLFPCVKDSLIISKELGANYEVLKNSYSQYLLKFALKMLERHPKIENLVIGSGLDDAIDDRAQFLQELKNKKYGIKSLNNNIEILKKARDIHGLYNLLEKYNYKYPISISADEFDFQSQNVQYPLILKKKKSSGGINIYKIDTYDQYLFLMKLLGVEGFQPNEWLVQEYIQGLPISCTIISDGVNTKVISINRQIIGEKFLNAPKQFAYCGNIVPANLLKIDNEIITEISLFLTKTLKLKGINGFDFVLKNHYPYLMEINPRIPGSLRVSENALNINLMDLHIQSFSEDEWNTILRRLDTIETHTFSTKLILFASQDIKSSKLDEISKLAYVHDKSAPDFDIYKNEPLCTILYNGTTFAESYFGALKVVDKIEKLIRN